MDELENYTVDVLNAYLKLYNETKNNTFSVSFIAKSYFRFDKHNDHTNKIGSFLFEKGLIFPTTEGKAVFDNGLIKKYLEDFSTKNIF